TISDTVATLWAQVTANGGTYTGAGRIDIHIDLTSTGIEDDPVASIFALRPGYPNPFAADTRLQLTLPAPERVVARVYNPAGRLVKTLIDSPLPAGEHVVPWNGTDERGNHVASGVYFVKLEAGADHALRKVVLLR
ncbi:MAG: T9SS type A sorting domain-containing protein, partial [Candidatus Eisenbacteria sp.]|nr:T9SS type A sorting domain-containing protein [Candidatus Eisenbacteria bacterium]